MRFWACLLLSLGLLATPASSQNLDVRVLSALEALADAATESDLVEVADLFRDLAGTKLLWQSAVGISKSEIGPESAGRAVTIRLLRLAAHLDSNPASSLANTEPQEPIDVLSESDVVAFNKAFGYPSARDPIRYLFARGPSLREDRLFGEYVAVRLAPDSQTRHLRERTTLPYLDLSPEWSSKELSASEDIVALQAGELAQTRRFNLGALPHLVLAAKSIRLAATLPSELQPYPRYVASRALNWARSLEGKDIAFPVWAAENALLRSIEKLDDPFLTSLAADLRLALPRSALLAGRYPDAAKAYHKAGLGQPQLGLWSTWGETISYFAADDREQTVGAIERVVDIISRGGGDSSYAYLLNALLAQLRPLELAKPELVEHWRKSIASSLPSQDSAELQGYDFSFAGTMASIGRTHTGLTHMLGKLESIRQRATVKAELEIQYLRSVAAFSRDLCFHISFEMTATKGWQPRSTAGYPKQLDFLHNLNDQGDLVGPGEVVVLDSGLPYGMRSPEEDLATTLAVYGVVAPSITSRGLIEPTPEHLRASVASGIARWAESARTREVPAPSIAPAMKLVWQEWFGQAFEALKDPRVNVQDFVYEPLDATGLTSMKQVMALLDHPAASAEQKSVLSDFLSLRRFLEAAYGRMPPQ